MAGRGSCAGLWLVLSLLLAVAFAPESSPPAASGAAVALTKPKYARADATTIATETLNSLIAENQVVIFSRSSGCSACQRVKAYFEDEGIPYYSLELDQRNDGDLLKKVLAAKTGRLPLQAAVPAVYIRGQFVSDTDVSQAYKTGELSHWTAPSECEADPRSEACV